MTTILDGTINCFNKNGDYLAYEYVSTGDENPRVFNFTPIDASHFFAYKDHSLLFITINGNKVIKENELNILDYVNLLYPNEEHEPKVQLLNLNVHTGYSVSKIEVLLYNGQKDIIELRLDNQTGDIIP